MNSGRYCENDLTIRPYRPRDEGEMSRVVAAALRISNSRDYSADFIEENVRFHSPEYLAQAAKETHFYGFITEL